MRMSVAVQKNAWKPSSGRRPAATGACILFKAVMTGTLALSRSVAPARGGACEDIMIKRLPTGFPFGASYAASAVALVRLAPSSLLRTMIRAAAILAPFLTTSLPVATAPHGPRLEAEVGSWGSRVLGC